MAMQRTRSASVVLLLLLIFFSAPIGAANLSTERCENRDLISHMEGMLRKPAKDGSNLISHGVFIEAISKSVTTHAGRNKLVCAVSLRTRLAGQQVTLRFVFTFQQFSSGQITATIIPR